MSSYQGKTPTPYQAGCPSCHRLFGGVTGFDEHRKRIEGSYRKECVDPSEIGYVEDERGVWRNPMEQEKVALFRQRVSGTRGRKSAA